MARKFKQFWETEGRRFREKGYSGELIFHVKEDANAYRGDDLINDLAEELKEVRRLDYVPVAEIVQLIATENGLKKEGDRYTPKRDTWHSSEGDDLNIGVLKSHNVHKPYALFRDVTREVRDIVSRNINEAKHMTVFTWASKVKTGGEWDYKNKSQSQSIFSVKNVNEGEYTGLFYMEGWDYKRTSLLMYDDVGNINYGATGKYLDIAFMREVEGMFSSHSIRASLNTLKWMGGTYQIYSDVASDIKDIVVGILDTKGPSIIIKEIIEKHLRDERNRFGDDPKDTYGIEWGYKNF